jgi:hypothetical protein
MKSKSGKSKRARNGNGRSRCLKRVVGLLSRNEVIEELEGEVETYECSYREVDGQIRDKGALRTIQALKQAIEAVKQPNA